VSRAREAESQQESLRQRPGVKGRLKSRGRNILADVREKVITPTESAVEESDDEGLGGCEYSSIYLMSVDLRLIYPPTTDGFFDAGMLLSASKISKEDDASEKAVQKSRHVGRRLRIAEY
jgi:hypothetical protein